MKVGFGKNILFSLNCDIINNYVWIASFLEKYFW